MGVKWLLLNLNGPVTGVGVATGITCDEKRICVVSICAKRLKQ
jgi:hypothetical protein